MELEGELMCKMNGRDELGGTCLVVTPSSEVLKIEFEFNEAALYGIDFAVGGRIPAGCFVNVLITLT